VFVTGYANGVADDYATVAYDAMTGALVKASLYNGPDNGDDIAYSVAVSPDGSEVFVTGFSTGASTGPDFLTAAYRA
jgi:hypothetical protein